MSLALPPSIRPAPAPTSSSSSGGGAGAGLALPGLARRPSQLSTSTLPPGSSAAATTSKSGASASANANAAAGPSRERERERHSATPDEEDEDEEDEDEARAARGSGKKGKKGGAGTGAGPAGAAAAGAAGSGAKGKGKETGGKEYKYSAEIGQMMFVFGEVQDPLPETTRLVEDIVRGQIIEIVTRARLLTHLRSSRYLSAEDVIFLIRDDRGKVNRLRTYLSWKDVRKKAKEDDVEDVELDEADKPAAKTRKAMMKLPWEVLTPFSDMLRNLPNSALGGAGARDEDDEEDEDEMQAHHDSMQRLREADEVTKRMSKDEYVHYSDCRQASFTYRKAKRFRDFINFGAYLDVRPNDDIVDILGFLAFEMVRSLCVTALQVRERMERAIPPPAARKAVGRSFGIAAAQAQGQSQSQAQGQGQGQGRGTSPAKRKAEEIVGGIVGLEGEQMGRGMGMDKEKDMAKEKEKEVKRVRVESPVKVDSPEAMEVDALAPAPVAMDVADVGKETEDGSGGVKEGESDVGKPEEVKAGREEESGADKGMDVDSTEKEAGEVSGGVAETTIAKPEAGTEAASGEAKQDTDALGAKPLSPARDTTEKASPAALSAPLPATAPAPASAPAPSTHTEVTSASTTAPAPAPTPRRKHSTSPTTTTSALPSASASAPAPTPVKRRSTLTGVNGPASQTSSGVAGGVAGAGAGAGAATGGGAGTNNYPISLFAPPPSARQPLLPAHVLEAFAQIQREQAGARVGGMRNFSGGARRLRMVLV